MHTPHTPPMCELCTSATPPCPSPFQTQQLEMLKSTDLSNVEYMPAYLNKRLNNRLWSRRKMQVGAGAM